MYYRPSIKCVHTGYLILFSLWGPVCTVVPHIVSTNDAKLWSVSCNSTTTNKEFRCDCKRNCCGTLYRQSSDRRAAYNSSQRPAIRSRLLNSVSHPSCSQATSVFPYLILFRDCRNYANRQITVNYRKSKQQLI